jgi:aspartokinase-like uncharacterized kinase
MSEKSLPLRVVKVGGSLLVWSPLARRLQDWLNRLRPARNVLIAGGGKLTDAIHELQDIQRFNDETAHWMCADALSATARMLAALVPGGQLKVELGELREQAPDQPPQIFDAGRFLYELDQLMPGDPLPHDWTATSDSIAARVAALLPADELLLFKSAEPPKNAGSLAELAEAGYVDTYFPRAAAELPSVWFINLRTKPSSVS